MDTRQELVSPHAPPIEKTASKDLMELSKEELVCRVTQLEAHVKQLKHIIMKSKGESISKKERKERPFDFNKYNTRHVALRIVYQGWDHQGFAAQEDTDVTIEHVLFKALTRTKLIQERETSSYHRCGRTDKGVSAFGQVISIDLRTNLLEGVGVKVREGGTAPDRPGDKTTEIRYMHILNKVLPAEIRVLAWSPVSVDFSARFSCKLRTYKYYFPHASLNLQAMRDAAAHLRGEHDFRNLCKMDVGNGVTSFTRRIDETDIRVIAPTLAGVLSSEGQSNEGSLYIERLSAHSRGSLITVVAEDRSGADAGFEMCELTVVGQAFLWHQIRCIVAVLFLVGHGHEKPQIIEELLDVQKHPCKPQYTMAAELPLVLFDSQFEDVEWIYELETHLDNIKHLQEMWTQHSIKSSMLKRMLESLETAEVTSSAPDGNVKRRWSDVGSPITHQVACLLPGNRTRVYRALWDRPTCESLETRIDHFAKRRKMGNTDS